MKNFFTSIRLILFFLFVILISVDLERESVHISEDSVEELRVRNFADFEEVIDNWDRTNVSSLIQINNEADVLSKRNDLIEYIWKDEFPDSWFSEINENVVDGSYEGIESLEKIAAFLVIMENQVSNVAYHFKAHDSNGDLIIYVQGHKGDFYWGRETIKFFLDNNYDVLAFSMPLMGV
jgi:hypothetical protein